MTHTSTLFYNEASPLTHLNLNAKLRQEPDGAISRASARRKRAKKTAALQRARDAHPMSRRPKMPSRQGRRWRWRKPEGKTSRSSAPRVAPRVAPALLLALLAACGLVAQALPAAASGPESQLRFDPQTSAYTGLTFTFDPRLGKQVEQRLHLEHWLSVVQQTSSLLYETLNGRAHLAEVRVLIPFKWRQLGAELRPVLYKPGAPVITNRRLRFTDSDVIVGFEDPIFKETPFAMQHDECGRPGLNIRMPISFLDQQQQVSAGSAAAAAGGGFGPKPASGQQWDARLKARQFLREFASHRFGIFKESGFRADFMYPPFTSVAGLTESAELGARARNGTPVNDSNPLHEHPLLVQAANASNTHELTEEARRHFGTSIAGFDEHFRECKFETSPASGLPASGQAANCLPYLVRATQQPATAPAGPHSFNLMSADPFNYVDLASGVGETQAPILQWTELAEQARWHFCGENFASPGPSPTSSGDRQLDQARAAPLSPALNFEHNQRATNKQNRMCFERSALEVIRASEDFRNQQHMSPPNFNRLPAPNFKFLQEMPPRIILGIEYTSHLFQSRRLDHAILESAINKFLAFDLIAESELSTVVFGQHQARQLDAAAFQRLDASLNSRFTLFNPAIDPFDEQVQYYSEAELAQLDVHSLAGSAASLTASNQQQQPARILKGSCSFSKLMGEVNVLLQKSLSQYDDVGADLIVLTSGLFVEDELKIEEILRASNFKLEHNRLGLILYPSTMLFDTKSRDGFIVLDSNESEQIIRSRLNKLLLIQRLTNGRLHLIREQVDSQNEVRMSTLMQFYQIFEQLAKGHSWDQTGSMVMLQHQQVDSRQQHQAQQLASSGQPMQQPMPQQQHRLTFHFNLDESVQNELIVGFIEPKVQRQQQQAATPLAAPSGARAGKRFSLRNLQLRSPGGHFVFTETNTQWTTNFNQTALHEQALAQLSSSLLLQQGELATAGESLESAFFPYRAQLSLAAFHVRPWHLSQLAANRKLAGQWTLSALSDEAVQTSGLALARVNPTGETITGNCWIQTYNQEAASFESQAQTNSAESAPQLRTVKVFVEVGGRRLEVGVGARMAVQDEMGNIVQNVQMLDDGLGAPDMTQNDGILSQYVQRASRPGLYRVFVELSVGGRGSGPKLPITTAQAGQDNVCCGSFIPNAPGTSTAGPSPAWPPVQAQGKSTRQLYCGTFFVGAQNKLAQQRPPRVSNLTVVAVDQDNRRVTLRWFEPQLEPAGTAGTGAQVARSQPGRPNQVVPTASESDLLGEESFERRRQAHAHQISARSTRLSPDGSRTDPKRKLRRQSDQEPSAELENQTRPNAHLAGRNEAPAQDEEAAQEDDQTAAGIFAGSVLIASHHQDQHQRFQAGRSVANFNEPAERTPLSGPSARYEIKLFTDRDVAKRAFDAKHEVGFRFNEWSVEGQFPNASQLGGAKEVTLRVPFAREGFYFIALKTIGNNGLSSSLSNVAQFYLRNNLTLDEVESIYNKPGITVDAEGNVYDQNGDILQRSNGVGVNGVNQLSGYSLLKGAGTLDGLSVLVLVSVLAFMMVVLCIALVACLANSARHSLKAAAHKSSTSSSGSSGSSAGRSKSHELEHAKKGLGALMLPGGAHADRSTGSGSSVVSSSAGCESSEVGACSGASSLAGSCTGHLQQQQQLQQPAGKLLLDELHQHQLAAANGNGKLLRQHRNQQQQAQLIHQQLMSGNQQQQKQQQQQQQPQEFYSQPQAFYPQSEPQHTIVNGYAYATVMQHANDQSYQQPFRQAGDLNQNGLAMLQHGADIGAEVADLSGAGLVPTSSAVVSPVQSWPADILLSHYDKVKQARERNEAPPVMRIETLEHGGALQYADGLPNVFENVPCDQQQPHPEASNCNPMRQHATANYYNQQLQQQLSCVLANKQQVGYEIDFRTSSPALEGLTGEVPMPNGNTGQATGLMPPPPQYIYCGPASSGQADTNGLGQQLTEPSIYSQATNLQQVAGQQEARNNYYANQQQQWAGHQQAFGMARQQPESGGSGAPEIYSSAAASAAGGGGGGLQSENNAAISEV